MSDFRDVIAEQATRTPQIAALDVPAELVSAEAILRGALTATHSPSDALAYNLDLRLITHPEAPVATESGDPEWDAWLAQRIADNTAAWNAHHQAGGQA